MNCDQATFTAVHGSRANRLNSLQLIPLRFSSILSNSFQSLLIFSDSLQSSLSLSNSLRSPPIDWIPICVPMKIAEKLRGAHAGEWESESLKRRPPPGRLHLGSARWVTARLNAILLNAILLNAIIVNVILLNSFSLIGPVSAVSV